MSNKKTKIIGLLVLISAIIIVSLYSAKKQIFTNNKEEQISEIKESEKEAYYLGYTNANKITNEIDKFKLDLTEEQKKALVKGILDNLNKKNILNEEDTKKISQELEKKLTQIKEEQKQKDLAEFEKNKNEGKDFINKYIKDKGAILDSTGFAYRVINKGTGDNIHKDSNVVISYQLKDIYGNILDEKHQVPTKPSHLLEPIEKVLLKNKLGSAIEIVIPSEIIFQDKGHGSIKAGSTFIATIQTYIIKEKPKNK